MQLASYYGYFSWSENDPFLKKNSINSVLTYYIFDKTKSFWKFMIWFFISTKKDWLWFWVWPNIAPFLPYSYIGPKKRKRKFILANVFSELLHSNTYLAQLTENQLKQPTCVCGPTTLGSKFAKLGPKWKIKYSIINQFFCHVLQKSH